MTRHFVVMGVSGSGKSLIGEMFAEAIGARFVDGDDLHPEANKAKMAAGEPLTDADRWPWLDRVGAVLAGSEGGVVIACSALKRRYRDRIAAAAGGPATFLYLTAPRAVIEERLGRRKGHFMPTSLLDSQIETLEPPAEGEDALRQDVSGTPDEIVADLVRRTGQR